MGYKKDIFAGFAYEFELSYNRWFLVIFRFRRSDIFCYAKCDIEACGFSDIIFAPSQVQVLFILKKSKSNLKVQFGFLVEVTGLDRLLRLRLAYYSLVDPMLRIRYPTARSD